MRKVIRGWTPLFLSFMVLNMLSARAEGATNEELMNEIRLLKQTIIEQEKRVVGLEERLSKLEAAPKSVQRKDMTVEDLDKHVDRHLLHRLEGYELLGGLRVGAGGTFVIQGTPNANNAGSGEDDIVDASWSADIELEKSFDDWGLAFLHLESGQNDTIESELSLFSNVNRDAGGTGARVDVTELWYEHYFFDGQFTLTGGKIDATAYVDQNEYANDETTQFLGHIFRNSPAIEWPADNNLGMRANISPGFIDFVEFELGYFEADGDWDDIFDHAFYMAQINARPAELLNMDSELWNGNYRFYGWINDQFHTELVDPGDTASADKVNYGFGASFDQMVTDIFGLFGRFGWQRPDMIPVDGSATIEWAWSAGAQMSGSYWNRKEDILAFAIGQAFPSDEYDDASTDNYGHGEGHIEAYYSVKLNDHLTISPDIQAIWNPNGVSKSSEGDKDTIFVYGMRGQVDF